jgi:DNA mismatch repair protein MutS2
VTNASVEFDLDTLAPTYHLSIGLPGHSNAFAIADRLGLPAPIVRRAQGLVSSNHLDVEHFLAQIKETHSQTAQVQVEVEETRAESQQLADDLRMRLANIEREREQILDQAREQAAEELSVVRTCARSKPSSMRWL